HLFGAGAPELQLHPVLLAERRGERIEIFEHKRRVEVDLALGACAFDEALLAIASSVQRQRRDVGGLCAQGPGCSERASHDEREERSARHLRHSSSARNSSKCKLRGIINAPGVPLGYNRRSAISLGGTMAARKKEGAARAPFKLVSPDIRPNGPIAMEQVFNGFGCSGENISPALGWSGAPEATKSLALLVHDPDAPTGGAG